VRVRRAEQGGLGNKLNGTKDGIKAATRQTLVDFRNNHYTGPRTVLVGTGAVSQKELEQLAQQHLGDLSSAENRKNEADTRYVGGDIRLWNLRAGLFHAAWAVETSGAMSGDTVLFQLVTHIHGKYHRSQHELGQHAIHRLVKTYSNMDFGTPTNTPMPEKSIETMQSFHHSYADTGLVGMYVVGRQSKTNAHLARSMSETLDHSVNDFARLAAKSVDTTELLQAKVNFKAQLMYNCDGSHNTAKELARQVYLYGRKVPLEEMYARIDDIAPVNIQETLQHYLTNRKPVFSLYGYFYPTLSYDVLSSNVVKYAL
jgi:predicted Zn-dependent peptidase